MKLLIKNGRVVDPANNIDEVLDILIDGEKISKVAKDIKIKADKEINASGLIVAPGAVDMHVHLREPGREDKETVYTGTLAALKGGVTGVVSMPNTTPAIDSLESIKLLKNIIKKDAGCDVYICGAITKNRQGQELVDIKRFAEAGVVAISDDGSDVDDENLFLQALKLAKKNKIILISHCEDKSLSRNGVVNRGIVATRLGLRGISKESEFLRVKRNIELAKKTNTAIHIAHVSCAESVDVIRKAKKAGVRCTCETAPHYFALSEDDIIDYDTNMKINPPLRTKDDISAIKQGLKDGIIDTIASDHAPHTENEKDIEFDRAEFGKIGLESGLAVSIMELIDKKILSWLELVNKIAVNPANILGIEAGSLSVGSNADIVIIDADKEFILAKEKIVSKSKNSPFIGRKVKGAVIYTIYHGKVAYQWNL
ncbi:MAG: dihydroorotase [Candidatus Omnitrophota bacterium]